MELLLDTSVLGRFVDQSDPLHDAVRQALRHLEADGHLLVVTPQVLTEFTSMSTRPLAVNGLGLNPRQVIQQIDRFIAAFSLRRPGLQEFDHFRALYAELTPLGKKIHDLRHVAAMKSLGLSHILTLNPADFMKAQAAGHITVHTPAGVLQSLSGDTPAS